MPKKRKIINQDPVPTRTFEHVLSLPTLLFAAATFFFTAFAFWYQFLRIDDQLIAQADLVLPTNDDLITKIFIFNKGNRPITILDLQNIFFLSKTPPLSISPIILKDRRPELPMIVNPGENHLITMSSYFKPGMYYPAAKLIPNDSGHIGLRIGYVGISWSVTNSRGEKFDDYYILGEMNMEINKSSDTIVSGGSYGVDTINLYRRFSWSR